MCGIFGYVGARTNAPKIVFESLKRLEYRGYDSFGLAVQIRNPKSLPSRQAGEIRIEKNVGPIGESSNFQLAAIKSTIAIGHTRWATHGAVTVKNAHPHFSSDKSFVLAHNGIVENFEDLKSNLVKKGLEFETETDTEVIVRLVENRFKKTKNLLKAVFEVLSTVGGRNTFIILTEDGQIIAARNGSPLVVGADNNSYYFSSDTLSFSQLAKKMMFVDNGQVAVFDGKKIRLFDARSQKELDVKFEKVTIESDRVDKEGYEHFMIKEIHEVPYVLKQLINQDLRQLEILAGAIKSAKNVYIIGSGTTGIAAAQIAYFLRENAKVNAISLVGADSYEYFSLFSNKDLIIAPSQSGETADVLEVLERAREKGVKIASNVNMSGSMMTKLSDFKFQTMAGPEICVVSTKVFVAHIAWGYLLSKTVSGNYQSGLRNLKRLASEIERYIKNRKNHQQIKSLANKLSKKEHIFLLGKAANFQIIREGMIKLIETSYKHAHAMPAGDLKHYAITLMDKGVPVLVAVSNDEVKFDVLNAVSEVKARGAEVIGISPDGHKDFDLWFKVADLGQVSPIFNVIPLQLLAYYMAVELGNNVDRPRNIAKSVTVK